jgi:hypothetical protein
VEAALNVLLFKEVLATEKSVSDVIVSYLSFK